MKKWLVYLFGIITGIIITAGTMLAFTFAFNFNLSDNSRVIGLEIFEEPGDYMDYAQFKVFKVLGSGCALAYADGATVLIIPNEKQRFYDDQKIVLQNGQCAQHVGTYKYSYKTVPVVRIIESVELPKSNKVVAAENNSGKTLFDKPGDCVSRKSFEVQKVLDSGDAIALEIRENISGYIITSDLEVQI